MTLKWLQDGWKEFLASADPDDLAAASSPASIAGGPGALIATLLALAYFPPLARISQLRHAWEGCALIVCGAFLTYVAWRRRCRGFVGSLATLLDNTFYSAGLALAAASSTEATGLALAVVHGLMVVTFPARSYAITWLFSAVMILPVLSIIAWIGPSLPVGLVLVASLGLMLVVSQSTRVQRADRLQRLRLEQALGAADRLADESVQTALTTTLLTLGHFLHELRNYQTAIAANLEYVEAAGDLAEGPQGALLEAQEAQRGQAELLRQTIEDLRGRAVSHDSKFLIKPTLEELRVSEQDLQLTVVGEHDFEINGNVENLRVVLLNLTRNAVQAGATKFHCELHGDASGGAAMLTISDNGSGIVPAKQATLFDSFAISDKPGGSGLGLYLVRRYVELLGGTIRVGNAGALGGAAFLIRLPGRSVSQGSAAGTGSTSA